MEITLGADILKALAENVLDYQKESETKKASEKKDDKRVEKNINSANKQVATTLTSSEKTRYQRVGDELFKITIEKLNALIQREKKAQRMSLDIPKENSSFAKKLKRERGNISIQQGDSKNFWNKLLASLGFVAGIYILFKDKIDAFFNKGLEWLSEIGDFIKPIIGSLSEVFKGLLKVIMPIGSALLDGIVEMFKPIAKYFDPSNPDNIFAKVGDFVFDAAKAAFNGLGVIFDSAVGGVKWLGETLWNALKAIGSTIGGVVVDAFKLIGNILGEVGTFLKDKIISAVGNLFGGDAGAVQQALGTAKSEAASASSVVQSALNQQILQRGGLDAMVNDAESFRQARMEAMNQQLGTVDEIKARMAADRRHGIEVKGDAQSGFTVNIDDKGKQHFIEVAAWNFGQSLFKRVAGVTSSNHGTEQQRQQIANALSHQLKSVASQFIKITNDNNIEINTGHESVKQAILNTHKWLSENTSWYNDTNDIADNLVEAIKGTNKDALNEVMAAAAEGRQHFQTHVRDRIDALNAHTQAESQTKTDRWKLIESQGLGPFTRHEEAMKTIKEVTDTLNKSLDTLHRTIGESFVTLVNEKLLSDVKVDVEPVDGRTAELHINQINVEALDAAIASLKEMETKNEELLTKQNTVLDDILKALDEGAASSTTVNNVAVVNGNAQASSSTPSSPNRSRQVPRPID